ncbi:MAG: DNRLRE domain-containing protein, partial [Acidimicrobiia bacterium]|nr:DNRLRE domain-containing protein [Acidimicrobiia bacterium]
ERSGGTGPHLVVVYDESTDPPDPPDPPGSGPVTIAAGGDATLRESRPDRNYGREPRLEVDSDSRKDIILGFDVAGLGDRAVERAVLRLHVLDASSDGGRVSVAEPSTWTEGTVTWNTAPPASSPVLGHLGAVSVGSWVEVDVTPAVAGDGPLTLRLTSSSSNGADYASAQDTAGRGPQLVITPAPPPLFHQQPSFPIRATFYYPWFPEVWTVNGAPVFYEPELGYYSSDDPSVQQAHITAMTDAGLDAAIASWWGFPNARDTRFAQLLDETTRLESPLKWAAYQEGEGRADPTPAEIAVDLEHLADLATSPAYLRVDGRFVVFVYNADNTDGCGVVDRWEAANALIGDEAYISLLIFPGYRSCPTQPDGWHQYAPAHSSDQREGYTYMVSPGFWRADEAQPRLERDLDRWRQDVQNMVTSGEPWQLIVSFNEWGEGTAIEASAEWGTSYLDVLTEALASTP